ncbi:unnamed protein product [Camellia sinensis]
MGLDLIEDLGLVRLRVFVYRYPIVLSHIQILCDHQTSPHLTSAQTTVARHRHLHRRKSPPALSHPHSLQNCFVLEGGSWDF